MITKAKIKDIQSLQHKKFRQESNLFLAEGPKVIKELLLERNIQCKEIFALQNWIDSLEADYHQLIKDKLIIVSSVELEKLATYATPNNVIGVFEQKITLPVIVKDQLTLVLDDIQDPGNMGTIIRTADWFGVKNIICSLNTVDIYNPKVVQSTMASLGRVNVVYTDLLSWLNQNHEEKVFAATLTGKPIQAFNHINGAIVMIGNEANGLSPQFILKADEKFTIPKFGNAESLNAAIATGIILYQLKG